MNKNELQKLREAAHTSLSDALKAEAVATYLNDDPGNVRTEAERAAYVAIDKIDELWQYARDLEARLFDVEGPLALAAEIDGQV